jgi:serine/threonine protein kinase
VKVFKENSAFPERVDREPQALRKVASPNVARYVGDGSISVDSSQSLRYLAYEFVDGSSVTTHLRGAPLSSKVVSQFAEGVLNGLASIHEQFLAHRDLSTNNIILKGNAWATPVIIDFGWARHMDLSPLTIYPQPTGTPQFMAPEQIAQEHGNPSSC